MPCNHLPPLFPSFSPGIPFFPLSSGHFSLIVGSALGLAIHLGQRITQGAIGMQKLVSRFLPNRSTLSQEEFTSTLVTIIILFCASGTGIYGSIVSGMTGDHTILISKSILDLFTAAIFGCTLGAVVSLVAIPQCIIFLLLFYAATAIYPLTNEAMIAAMILVMPISALWANYIMPLVS